MDLFGRLTILKSVTLILGGAAGITGFPFWVQLLAYIFFDAIDRDSDGDLTFDEIKNFYQNLVGVKNEDLERVSKEGFRVMTAVS